MPLLPWLQLRHLDLAGATACSDDELAPLSRLSTLTSLSLSGLWRVTGSSCSGSSKQSTGSHRRGGNGGTGGAGGSGQGPAPLDVLAAIVGANRGLLSLDVGGTAVPIGAALAAALDQLVAGAPNATKAAHGLQRLRLAGCSRGAGEAQHEALRRVLLACPALTWLDAAGEGGGGAGCLGFEVCGYTCAHLLIWVLLTRCAQHDELRSCPALPARSMHCSANLLLLAMP